ncbi:MAG: cupin domain-containing protein [Paludibacterium sp.]|uniref:cupin domain-containing protein n=1 Tax=Paludibacterium sp. TaxID=1917523 RepID=UPI0025F35142|nr:cupin domain-containing protein [Paludibacterium sp.]MBV8048619.1 cupin domain-containing protein [Paludibacterium sp.]MBV8648062.1 cupin domain-containing protein [Paludibacterium sp.]
MTAPSHPIVHIDDIEDISHLDGEHWGGSYKPLTPALDALPGRLGANLSRVPPGRSACPFHTHAREDEVFYILSGRGVFRYGDALHDVGPGHCIACPAGSGIGHQLANPYDEDLVYLAVGVNDPDEVCTYPDNGKILVRSLKTVGVLSPRDYMDGEPEMPKILALAAARGK